MIEKKLWGTAPDGKEIYLYTLTNASGAYVKLCSVGAAIVSIVVPDKTVLPSATENVGVATFLIVYEAVSTALLTAPKIAIALMVVASSIMIAPAYSVLLAVGSAGSAPLV